MDPSSAVAPAAAGAVTVQCPYTLSTCPLFNPGASVLETTRQVPRPIAGSAPTQPDEGISASLNASSVPQSNLAVEEGLSDESLVYFYGNYSLAPTDGRGAPGSSNVTSPSLPPLSRDATPQPSSSARGPPYDSQLMYNQAGGSRPGSRAEMTGRASSTRASPEAGPSTGSNAGPSRPTSPYNIDGGVHDENYGLEGFAATAASTEAITPFISKLSHLLSQPREFASVIRWSSDGSAFVFAHSCPELLDVFARYFRHSNVHSFVRQLNIYGFQRLSTFELLSAIPAHASATDYSGFSHPMMWREGPEVSACDLSRLKPKGGPKARAKASLKKGTTSAEPTPMRKSLGGGADGGKAGGARKKLHV